MKQKYFIINNLDVYSETQLENQQLLRQQVDKSTKMGRNQHKKRGKHAKPEHLASYKGPQPLTSKGTKLDEE